LAKIIDELIPWSTTLLENSQSLRKWDFRFLRCRVRRCFIFWNVAPYSLLEIDRRFRGTWWRQLEPLKLRSDSTRLHAAAPRRQLFSDVKTFPRLLWDQKVHCRVIKRPSLGPVLSQISPVDIFTPYFFKTERRGRSVNTHAPHSGGPEFKSQPRVRLSWQGFHGFSQFL
jgi:hypothetical protein